MMAPVQRMDIPLKPFLKFSFQNVMYICIVQYLHLFEYVNITMCIGTAADI